MLTPISKSWLKMRAGLATLLAAILLSSVFGCGKADQPTVLRNTSRGQSSSQHLDQVLQFVNRLDEFERDAAILQATYHLNRWSESETFPSGWSPEPLVKTLPRFIQEGPEVAGLGNGQFHTSDVELLLESVWMRDLANWVSHQPVASPLAKDLEDQVSIMESIEADQLTIAFRLFDWTVRSMQLSPWVPYPADAVAIGPETPDPGVRRPPPMRAVGGPGYRYTPGQTLLYGHGDALNRARVFILLARQQGIHVVMLAFPGQTTPPRPRPWLPAALIGEQLYLFDTQLGIPIPGPDGRLIATFEEVREQPELLETLNVGDEFKYRARPDDATSVLALIDAAAPALSQRMQMVEGSFLGEDRVTITIRPSEFAERVASMPGVSEVQLWTLPFETTWYAAAVQQMIGVNQRAASEYYLRYGIFFSRNSMLEARYHHLRGELDKDGDAPGAKTLYLESRVPKRQLEELFSSKKVQSALGIKKADESDMVFQNRIAYTQAMMSQTKLNSTYWLGLAHFDSGRWEAALPWFKARTLEATPDSPWIDAATYNLARCYEALGQVSDARDIYLRDDSVQQLGNILRARQLRKHVGATP